MKKAATTLRNLERTTEFMGALNSEIGKLLFEDLAMLLDEKFTLIYEEKSDKRDRAIFSACKYIAGRWNSIIDNHSVNAKEMRRLEEKAGREII